MTRATSIAQSGANNVTMRNKIINGNMMIDQRNAGASVTPTSSQYSLDRWNLSLTAASKFSFQQSTTAPTGFSNSILFTSTSAYSVGAGDFFLASQWIEGFNTADLMWGTANAQTVTLSFWVRSSLTGTFGGCVTNSAQNRSYPFTFTISSANTFEYKTVTIAGDTSGTWVGGTNGRGMGVWFSLGAGSTYSGTSGAWSGSNVYSATGATNVLGTSGATLYITGVQLEAGTTATPFEQRLYGTELALCQRYYEKSYNIDVAPATNTSVGCVFWMLDATASYSSRSAFFKSTKRATPTVVNYSTQGTSGKFSNVDAGTEINGNTIRNGMSCLNGYVNGVSVGASVGVAFHWTADSEL